MKNLVIFGSGQHSKVVVDEINRLKKFNLLGYLSNQDKKKHSLKKVKFLGNIKNIKNINYKNYFGIIAVGQGNIREKILKEIKNLKIKIKWEKIISKDAKISTKTEIGEGTVIISGSVINRGTKIGKHCLINTGSIIDHDNQFGNFSSCGPGVITGGNVKVGKFSFLGIGSVIKNNIKIKNNTIIGAKSLILKDCKQNSVYFGSPAKFIKIRKKDDKYL